MTLGARRADAVEHYLAQLGVLSSRAGRDVRGALDARGARRADVGDPFGASTYASRVTSTGWPLAVFRRTSRSP